MIVLMKTIGREGRSAMRDMAVARTSERKTVVMEKHKPIADCQHDPLLECSQGRGDSPSMVCFKAVASLCSDTSRSAGVIFCKAEANAVRTRSRFSLSASRETILGT
jgi:hypothetical protein